MCNGYRHSPGCECGFGPRYLDPGKPLPQSEGGHGDQITGVIRERRRENWAAKSVSDADNIVQGLGDLGLKPRWLKSILKKYNQAGYPLEPAEWSQMSKGRRRSAGRKLMRLLGLREEIVAELEPVDVEIPLFRLQPPGVANCEVSYEEVLTRVVGWKVFLEILGTGTGADLSLRLEARGKIFASDKCKLITLPVRIRARIINLYLGNLCIARNKLIAEAGNKRTGQVYRRTIRSCDEYVPPALDATMVAEYNLLHELPGKNSEFSLGWGRETNRSSSFSIPIPELKIGMKVRVLLENELELGFDLAAGYDYELYPIPAGLGISWKVEGAGLAA